MALTSIVSLLPSGTQLHESDDASFNPPTITSDAIHWIHINRIDDQTLLETILTTMGLSLALVADIQMPIQQPFDGDDEGCMLVKLPYSEKNSDNNEIHKTQIAFVLTPTILLTCADGTPEFLNRLRKNLLAKRLKLKTQTIDRLFYILLEGYNDNYYHRLRGFMRQVNQLEERLLQTRGNEDFLVSLLDLRQEMSQFGDDLLAWGEFFNDLKTLGTAYINEETTARFLREMGPDMAYYWQEYRSEREDIKELLTIQDLFVNNRMNKTMQILAAISTIFLPLTFIVGLYGMNLYMPEATWPYMYPTVWLIMLTITILTIVWMKRRRMF